MMVPVVVDGEVLFRVGASGGISATDRATFIHDEIYAAIAAPELPSVTIGGRSKLPTINLDDRHLLTVTEADILPGQDVYDQALRWKDIIEQTLRDAKQARSPEYIQQRIFISIAILAATLLIHLLISKLWQRIILPFLRTRFFPAASEPQEPSQPSPPHRVFDALLNLNLLLLQTSIWIASLILISKQFLWTKRWSYYIWQSLTALFTAPSIGLGQNDYSITALLLLLLAVVTLFILSKNVTDLFRARVLVLAGVPRGAQGTISIIVRYALVFFGSLGLLQIWGIDISSLTILASSLGIGIGFGLQDIAKNFGSGLVLVFERPIQVGDFVEVGEFQGTVEHIGARSTLIRTLDQVSIIVPNSRFLENEVINWSLGNPISRIRVPVGVAYGSDIALVNNLFLDAAHNHASVLSTPPPQVFFIGFGSSSLDFEIMVWTAEPSQQLRLKSDLYFAIEALLREHQVEIPFPQQDLHVRSGRLPIELSPQLEESIQQFLSRPAWGKGEENGDRSSQPDRFHP